MDAEAVANRSSYWKLAAALQSFLLLLQKKRLGKENEPGGISISLRTSLKRPGKPFGFLGSFPRNLKQLRTSDADLVRFIEADDPVRRFL